MTARLLLAVFAAITLSHCAIGTTRINVSHSPVAPVSPQRTGKVQVRPFTDSRDIDGKLTIGNKRNGYGMVLGTFAIKNGSVAGVMTDATAEALRAAGYTATVGEGGAGTATLEGDVYEFWLDLFMATWHNVGVRLKLKNRAGNVVWEKTVNAKETNVLWVGLNSEIEKVIRQSVDKALAEASREFAKDSFAAGVR